MTVPLFTGRRPAEVPTVRYIEHVMGMPISLALRGRHTRDEQAKAAWTQVMSVLQDVDRMFSTYRPDSFISRLRRGEVGVEQCPSEVSEVLALGAVAERESAGAFSLHLPGPDGQGLLHPTGVVKGWAVDRAAASLKTLPDTDFCLSAGGDMLCRTLDAAADPWRIGVEDPADPTRVIAVIPVHTGAVATSGATHRGPHLLDARTGRQPIGVASVTVVAPTLTWADIDATAAYAQGLMAAHWLRSRVGRVGFVVWDDGTTTTTGAPGVRGALARPASDLYDPPARV